MVRGVPLKGVRRFGENCAVDRRQAIGLAALVTAFGLIGSVTISNGARAAKKRKKRKNDKTGKNKKGTKQGTSGSGREVVRVAQKYEGARYVWGGASPKGFDCSGFTWYVYQKATGMDITRGVEEQWQLGRSVGRGDWQAGDIVFFENTYKRGLSHNGIYIGGNKFIHAENEETGVIISMMDSDYYSARYAGARRLV